MNLIAQIEAEGVTYDRKHRAEGDAIYAKAQAEGDLAENQAQALGEKLRSEALATRAGRTFSAIEAVRRFQLGDVLLVTFEVVFAVVLLSGLIGVPAAYAMARREFAGKKAVMLLFLLPLLIPPITYGIPLATVLYQAGLGGTLWGVILANLVPTVPFVILVMIPFVEQIDPRVESAARVFGAEMCRPPG